MLHLPLSFLPLLSVLVLLPAATSVRVTCFPRANLSPTINPEPTACHGILAHLPSSFVTLQGHSYTPSYQSVPFLPRAMYHAPSCVVRLRFSPLPPYTAPGMPGPDLALIAGYPPVFELYAAMKFAGTQVTNQCTGQRMTGGSAKGVTRGIYWDVAVAPSPDDIVWNSVVQVPNNFLSGRVEGRFRNASPGWSQTLLEVA